MKFYTIKHKPTNLFLSDYYFVNSNIMVGFYVGDIIGLPEKDIQDIMFQMLNKEVSIKFDDESTNSENYEDFEIVSFEI